jgi:hypothetical protein
MPEGAQRVLDYGIDHAGAAKTRWNRALRDL